MSAHSRLTGIELDSISASIARLLYPDADIRNQGFESARLVDGGFDLAISNVPFGDYKLHDPQFNERNFLVHDYFFAKGVEKVRPGWLMVLITSKGTLDKIDSRLRDHLHDKADFLGAIRLPNTAFKQNANTEVTADILFLRKLEAGEIPSGLAWSALAEHSNEDGVVFQINEYFAANPHMMLGTMQQVGSMYRGGEPALASDGRDLAEALRVAVGNLPANIYRQLARERQADNAEKEDILAPDYVKENAYALHDGLIAMRVGNVLQPLENLSEDRARRIRGLIKLRDAVRATLRTQIDGRDEETILHARRILNEQYDYFTARFGPLNEKANLRAFDSDPDLPLLLSLEDFNDETRKATKTAIFRERTIQQAQAPRFAETPKDALVLALNATGRADLATMEALLSQPPEEFLPELKGMVYRNPQSEQWETDDEYLSGDVRSKFVDARAAAEADAQYRENVTALEAVQPADLSASEVDARLGAVWIPATDIEAFARTLLGSEGITVQHAAAIGTWFMKADFAARGTVANTTEWGTTRYSAIELIQDALNLKTPTVYDSDPKTDARIINPQQTEGARTRWTRSRIASKAGFGRTMSAAKGCAANTTMSSTASACASSMGAT